MSVPGRHSDFSAHNIRSWLWCRRPDFLAHNICLTFGCLAPGRAWRQKVCVCELDLCQSMLSQVSSQCNALFWLKPRAARQCRATVADRSKLNRTATDFESEYAHGLAGRRPVGMRSRTQCWLGYKRLRREVGSSIRRSSGPRRFSRAAGGQRGRRGQAAYVRGRMRCKPLRNRQHRSRQESRGLSQSGS